MIPLDEKTRHKTLYQGPPTHEAEQVAPPTIQATKSTKRNGLLNTKELKQNEIER